MRIIAGTAKGRPLKAPEGMDTRPTLDKVREAIFGKLQFDIPGSRVLDMFAGSGAIGCEALSRGAESCVFIDKSRVAMRTVRENVKNCGFEANAVFLMQDFEKAAEGLTGKFDFIFIDPPYSGGLYEKAFETAVKLIEEYGMIIAEHDAPIPSPKGFELISEKKYSSVYVSYFRKEQAEE